RHGCDLCVRRRGDSGQQREDRSDRGALRGLYHSRNVIPEDFLREPCDPWRRLGLKALRPWTAKPSNREERKDKRAKIAKQDYALLTFITRSDFTGGFLRDLCETLASFAVKSSSPVDARPFNRDEQKTSETTKQDYA